MTTPLVKICGIKTPEALQAAIDASADFIGFVFYPASKRAVTIEQAASLIARVPEHIKTVALFVDADDAAVDAVVHGAKPDMLQLHGSETPERVRYLKTRHGKDIIAAIRVAAPEDLISMGAMQSAADWILFDARTDTASPGGNGAVFDWQLLKNLKITKPWMLSGGLNAGNIGAALSALKPNGVDISSGVEDAPGVKNPAKIREFIELVKSC